MKTRVFVIFGVSYSTLLVSLAGLDTVLARFANWDPASEGIDNLFGILFFTVAILLSMTRKVHAAFGGAPDLITFRGVLAESRWSLTIGMVIIATLINLALATFASWHSTDEMAWPSPLRTAVLSLVYGVLARVVIVESVERMRYA